MNAHFFAPYDAELRSAPLASGVAVRAAVPADAEVLAGIELAVRGGDPAERAAQMRRALASDSSALFVAQAGPDVLAYAKAQWLQAAPIEAATPAGMASSPPGYYLAGCTVHPRARRRSLGRSLTRTRMDWIARRCLLEGAEPVAWYFANAANRASLAMHEEFGFIEAARGTRLHDVTFTGDDDGRPGIGVLLRAPVVEIPQRSVVERVETPPFPDPAGGTS